MFTAEDELLQKYNPEQAQRLVRLRDMYTWYLSNPDSKDRQFIDMAASRHGLSRAQAYNDLAVIKTLLPLLASASRDFHRYRYNEMILETYQMAKARKDTKTMEKAASSYAKFNRVDLEDEQAIPYDKIVVQPFTATDDPRVLGIEPIPNLKEKIRKMQEKYSLWTSRMSASRKPTWRKPNCSPCRTTPTTLSIRTCLPLYQPQQNSVCQRYISTPHNA